jgi:nucleotide-binding universal stress UspA family protein
MAEINFSKILVAINGSKSSLDATNYAIGMAEIYLSELTALYIVFATIQDDYDSDMPLEKLPGSVKKIMNGAKRDSDPWFTKIRGEISAETSIKLHTKIIITQMKVSGAIVNYAEETNTDLIVVGTRGRSGFKRLLLGSVASDVVTYAHCPILVVK